MRKEFNCKTLHWGSSCLASCHLTTEPDHPGPFLHLWFTVPVLLIIQFSHCLYHCLPRCYGLEILHYASEYKVSHFLFESWIGWSLKGGDKISFSSLGHRFCLVAYSLQMVCLFYLSTNPSTSYLFELFPKQETNSFTKKKSNSIFNLVKFPRL